MAMPPPCNSSPSVHRRDDDSAEKNEGKLIKKSRVHNDKDFVAEELNTDPLTKVDDQSDDPFAKLKSSGGVASLTDREIFDMWLAIPGGGKPYCSQQDEDKAFDNFRNNIRDEPANEDQYAYNRLAFADRSKEEIAEIFSTFDPPDQYNAYIFKSNIVKWPEYAKLFQPYSE